jgi:hypothetical protein
MSIGYTSKRKGTYRIRLLVGIYEDIEDALEDHEERTGSTDSSYDNRGPDHE